MKNESGNGFSCSQSHEPSTIVNYNCTDWTIAYIMNPSVVIYNHRVFKTLATGSNFIGNGKSRKVFGSQGVPR